MILVKRGHGDIMTDKRTGSEQNNKTHKTNNRRKRGKASLLVFAVLLLIVSAAGILVHRDYRSRVYSQYIVEAGNFAITPEDFLKDPAKTITFAEDFESSSVSTNIPGTYEIRLKSGIYRYTSTLIVEDTTPPSGEAVEVVLEYGTVCPPEDFVNHISDVQNVEVSYVNTPDFSRSGKSDIQLILTDASGNQTALKSSLTIIPVKKELIMEAGDALPSIHDFMLDGTSLSTQSYVIEIVTDLSLIPTQVPGNYEILFRQQDPSGESITYDTQLIIRDTVPPVLVLNKLDRYLTSDLLLEDFIAETKDATELTFQYETEPDQTKEGTQEVAILASDLGGNTTRGVTELTLIKDTEPPVIRGVSNIVAYKNKSVSYKNGVTVKDNCDSEVILNVNADSVDLTTEGSYPVTYSAVDRAGNYTEAKATVTVIAETYSEETIYALAQNVLDDILTPGMTDYEKLSAIYYWVRKSISYTEMDVKGDWLKAAYYGFNMHKGDCYIFCMTSKALLDAAGIKNMVIDTLPIKYVHYWNLVDIGEGWRHFDTTPRLAGGVFLYLDDASIKEYSDAHDNSHIYDKDRFPDIP